MAIANTQCPSKSDLELKVGHAETMCTAEKLTEVTSLAQQERHAQGNASTKTFGTGEPFCSFKTVTKLFDIHMPGDSEALRARHKLTQTLFNFRFPLKGVCRRALWLLGTSASISSSATRSGTSP